MKRSDIKPGVEYAKQAPGSRRSPDRVRVVDTEIRVQPGRWETGTGDPLVDYRIVSKGQGVLVQEWNYADEAFGRYAVVQTSHLQRTWAEQAEADERSRIVAEQHRVAAENRKIVHDAEVTGLTEQAKALGLSVGTYWPDNAEIEQPRDVGARWALTGEALSRLLEMAASAPRPVTALEG